MVKFMVKFMLKFYHATGLGFGMEGVGSGGQTDLLESGDFKEVQRGIHLEQANPDPSIVNLLNFNFYDERFGRVWRGSYSVALELLLLLCYSRA